ncbi:hypothetical protein LCGC14_1721660 [marine sediment metagenome]|uniref:DUF4443 domain-containing protein n=1 Tax=marine sediment metagenome TaxID=412755 RepID=A0A0F9HCA6_9ZZZZ
MFEELNELFQSSTSKPTFETVHVILAIFIFGENLKGIGRYSLAKELLLGEGSAKTLLRRLKEQIKFISLIENEKRKGHVLTRLGLEYLSKIRKFIPIIKRGEISVLKNVVVKPENGNIYFCLVKKVNTKITDGVAQRDAAIKINGSGATCLVFNGSSLVFPSKFFALGERDLIVLDSNILRYFNSQIMRQGLNLEIEDIIIVGSGENPQKARLATLNAALTLL